ncbi:MAG: TonB-dependent receptor plug domain-containing protein [Povalibacter sp.]
MPSAQAADSQSALGARELVDLDLEQLMQLRIDTVYAASKHEERVTDAPSSISIVTADEIRRFGHRTLSDVLRSVRGLFVSSDRNYTYLGFRGFHRPNDYTTRVLVLINGHRINDNVYDSGTIGREGMVDVELIDRVEIIRGPSSSIYGSSAFFGVINVVTKTGARFDGMEASAEAASFGSYKTRMTYGAKSQSGVEWMVSGSHFRSEGPRSLYYPEFDQRITDEPRATNNGIAERLDGEESSNVFASVNYKDLALSAYASDRAKNVPTASFETLFNDDREQTSDGRYYLDLSYQHAFASGSHLEARGFYDRSTYGGDYPYDYAAPGDPVDAVVSVDRGLGEWIGAEWQLTMPLWGQHKLMVGGEYRDNLQENQYVYDDVLPRVYVLHDERSSHTFGLFAQGEARLTEKLTMTAGLRFDDYSATGLDVINPRVAFIYSPSAGSAIKALYGEAFRAPNPYENYYNDEQLLRPSLRPETIKTYELVYERYFGQHYRMNVSGYTYRVKDLISQGATDAGDLYFDNLDNARAHGMELEFEAKLDSGALARASYAIQRATDAMSDQELSSSPHELGKLNVSYPFLSDKLVGSLELQYHSRALTLDGGVAGDFLLTNLTLLSRAFNKHLEVSGSIYNVFGTHYGYPGAEDHLQSVIEQDGRTAQIKFTYGF